MIFIITEKKVLLTSKFDRVGGSYFENFAKKKHKNKNHFPKQRGYMWF